VDATKSDYNKNLSWPNRVLGLAVLRDLGMVATYCKPLGCTSDSGFRPNALDKSRLRSDTFKANKKRIYAGLILTAFPDNCEKCMPALPVFSSAATGLPFIFSSWSSPRSITEKAAKKASEILAQVGAVSKLAAVVPASRLEARPAPEMVSSGIPQLDALTGGLARGCLTEICGTASSGRTSVLLFALARATQRGEICALVDACDAFDPSSAAAASMEMTRLLWVRCGGKYLSCKDKNKDKDKDKDHALARKVGCLRTDDSYQGMSSGIPQVAEKRFGFSRWEAQLSQMLKVTDLLLQSNGFGMIALDLGDVPVQSARRIPLASWFRFRRAIEHTPTVLLVLEQQPIAGSCSSVLVKVSAVGSQLSGNPPIRWELPHLELPHSELLDQFEITAELLRSRLERKLERKPVQSTASFKSRAAWAG
jgi:recombination protein RecA